MNRFGAFCVVGAAALGLAGAAYANHGWSNYHWARTSHPMPLKVVDSVTSFWQYEFETAISEWNQSAVLDMVVVAQDDSSRTRRQCRPVPGQIRVCNDTYGNNGWLGLATIGIDSQGHIDQGTAKMNDTYSSYWTDPNERRHVMCQEVGHDFGLGHTSENGTSQKTCMDYSSDPNSISPNSHDYDQLLAQHDHFDSYNSYDDTGTGGGGGGGDGGGCNAPPGKGCNKFGAFIDVHPGVPTGAIRVQRNKFEEVWIKGRSDGGLWIFHVRLVDGHDDHGHEH